ncbi:MAG: hypothetical protein AABZ39_07345 [Spirochaetota bacterium]
MKRILFLALLLTSSVFTAPVLVSINGEDHVQVPYMRWLAGRFTNRFDFTLLPRNLPIPADTPLVIYSRQFNAPVIRIEGVRLSKRRVIGGEFTAIYFFRLLSSDAVPWDQRMAVHYRQGQNILINNDHNFRQPMTSWKPGELIEDGPYRLTFPRDAKPGEVSLNIILNRVVISSDSEAKKVQGKTYSSVSYQLASFPLGASDTGDEIYTVQRPERQHTPYMSIAENVRRYAESGGAILVYGFGAAGLEEMLPCAMTSKDEPAALIEKPNALDLNTEIPQAHCAVKALDGAKTVLRFADGVPALAVKKLGRGSVYYWSAGFGRDYRMPPITPYHDDAFVRILHYAMKKDLAAVTAAERTPGNETACLSDGTIRPWQQGVSENNFGRFGWKNNDGLLVGEFTEKGSLVYKKREIMFFTSALDAESVDLAGTWDFIADTARAFSPASLPGDGWKTISVPSFWQAEGMGRHDVSWYRLRVDVPSRFAGKDLELDFGAIDDFDTAYVNGVEVGTTDKRTEFWWSAPRSYPVRKDIVKAGAENIILVRVENNKGDAGICKSPVELRIAGTAARSDFTVSAVNWFSKTITAKQQKNTVRSILSLAVPGLVMETDASKFTIAGVKQRGLVFLRSNTADVRTGDVIRYAKAQGALSAGVIGGWTSSDRSNAYVPFLLVLERAPESLSANRTGITMGFPAASGRMMLLFPSGEKWYDGDTEARWTQGDVKEIEEFMRFWWPRALSLPVRCTESFVIDRAKGCAVVRSVFDHTAVTSDWNVTAESWSPIPPLAGFEKGKGFSEIRNDVVYSGCQTPNGPLYIASGRETILELPLPPSDHFGIVPREGSDALQKSATEHFLLPMRWGWRYAKKENGVWRAWGGQEATNRYLPPEECDYIDLANMRKQLSGILSRFILEPPGVIAAHEQCAGYRHLWNFFQPVAIQEYRTEPFSGISYPVNTIFTTGQDIYNDVNEFCANQQYFDNIAALYAGDWSTAASTWSFSQFEARFLTAMHDWGYMASGCREWGGGSFIDMLDAEMPGAIAHARIADAIGDTRTADFWRYMSARQAMPMRTRMHFRKYAKNNGFLSDSLPDDDQTITGFKEGGPDVRPISARRGPPCLYDTAGIGIPPETMLFHKTYTLAAAEAFEKNVDIYASGWREDDIIGGPWSRLHARAFLDYPTDTLAADLATVDTALAAMWRESRHGNYAVVPAMLAARDENFFLADWSGISIQEAWQRNGTITLRFDRKGTTVKRPALVLFSRGEIRSVTLNGAKASFSDTNGMVHIDIGALTQGAHECVVIAAPERTRLHPYLPKWGK